VSGPRMTITRPDLSFRTSRCAGWTPNLRRLAGKGAAYGLGQTHEV